MEKDFSWLVGQFLSIVDVLISAVFALTFLVLVWIIINTWIINGGDETVRKQSKTTIMIGVLVLVVMSAVWGIVALLQSAII